VSSTTDRLAAALADRYRIEREIGAGGMATVFLADDLKHRRKVAIKVLREDLSASVGAARFLREIEIAAQLQHPNILPLLDSGAAAGLLFYVMPYVEGQSLRQRLVRERELPVGEAVRLLQEIVDALSHAHQRGVVHRDIKPDNIMLIGRHAVVADFGVARALSEATGREGLTSMGVALGTPAYMAPEQATADPSIDQRADIYAIGVVAYELLAGRPPFVADSPQQVLAAQVMTPAEPLSRHRPGIPAALEQVVMRCLEKLPADRFQTAEELLVALEPLATPSGGLAPTNARLPASVKPTSWRPMAVVAVLLAAVALGAWAMRALSGPTEISLGRSSALTTETGLEIVPAISPDGRFVAYSAGNSASMRVLVRPVGGGRAIPMSDDSTEFQYRPRWSPDGTRLLYLNATAGVVVAPPFSEAGTARAVIPPRTPLGFGSADWSPAGDEIAVVYADTLGVLSLSGGAPRIVAVVKDLNTCVWSPDSRWFACVKGNSQYVLLGVQFGNLSPSTVVVIPSSGGDPIDITDAAALNHSPEWSADSKRLYFVSNRDGPRDIYVQQIDDRGRPRGALSRVSTGLEVQSLSLTSDDSRVAYSVYRATANIWSVPFPKSGSVTTDAATPLSSGNQIIEVIRVSRDRKWLIYDSNIRGNSDIWRIPTTGGAPEQLTSEPFDEFAGDASPDGSSIAYHSFRTPGLRQVEVKPLNGGPVERVSNNTIQESNPIWSPDGQSLTYFEVVPPFRISVARRTGSGTWSARILTNGVGPRWMPDGRSITFGAVEQIQGQVAIVMRAMPADSGPRRAVIPFSPRWGFVVGAEFSTDGRQVYLKSHDTQGRASIWSVPLSGGESRLLMHFPDPTRPSYRPSFTTDGKRIYFPIEDRQSDVHVAEVVKK